MTVMADWMVYWQRQGVSETLNARFGQCRCEAKHCWFMEIHPHIPGGYAVVEASYPNCAYCYASRGGQVAIYERISAEFRERTQLWPSREEAERLMASKLPQFCGHSLDFHPGVQAYCYYTRDSLQSYPYLKDDYFRAAALCNWEKQEIVALDGHVLVMLRTLDDFVRSKLFENPLRYVISRLPAETPIIEDAIRAWQQPSNQPSASKSEQDSKGWLTWLISEQLQKDAGYESKIVTSMFTE